MKAKLIPVILSGGAGTRLWPLSRKHYPKQFIPLFNQHSLFMQTLHRIQPLAAQHTLVVCNEAHRFMVLQHLADAQIKQHTVISEPCSRNTAPAIALAAFWVLEHYPNSPLLVLPSDHYMAENDFASHISDTVLAAAKDCFVTFGVKPTRAESGYGYIKVADKKTAHEADSPRAAVLYDVARFVEKPTAAAAERYIQSGLYYWNSGIFLFAAADYLEALKNYQSDVYQACRAAWDKQNNDTLGDHKFIRPDSKLFEQCPDISIDYAVMERVKNIRLCALDSHWSDLGSWQALAEVHGSDHNNNTLIGARDIVIEDSQNTIVQANGRLVVCLGLKDHLVVETKDAVLVADRARGQEIKQVVAQLRAAERSEGDWHKKVYRPWGSYEAIDCGDNFQVKRIIVNCGQRLSLQSHRHRAEHWVVVKGSAQVTLDEKTVRLEVNESIHIPIAAKHRLENISSEPLHLIEVQCGDYLGEDDITRYEDNYGRTNE